MGTYPVASTDNAIYIMDVFLMLDTINIYVVTWLRIHGIESLY